MNYNFDEIIPRRGTNSYKWDCAEDASVLPLWVADMDFRTAPEITEALRRRVEHGIFGYTKVPDRYYEAITSWFARRHNWHTITRDMIIYTSGVVPALSAIIKALTTTGDQVILQSPVYNCFFSSIRNNGCVVADCPLIYENNTYRMDFEALERTASDPKTRLMLLCNPHNPAGRVWTREELTRVGDICIRHGVIVVADEIHCELTFPGHPYTPFASIGEKFLSHSVTCCSPSKAFNIAGLQIANIIAADEDMRTRIDRAITLNEVCNVNPFGVEALITAYNHGEDWLKALLVYLEDNYRLLCDFFTQHLPDYPVCPLEGTYLVWVDFRRLGIPSKEMEQRLITEHKVWFNAGPMYGAEGFMRINIACPRSMLAEGLKRLLDFINKQ
ncbi:MAG: pyridoxal phosphate-dependent aminotransferase [Paraprevotella sp.]|nr:pyridoxal phosphate-dependent aminotransferase [Paraprevotella sp.]